SRSDRHGRTNGTYAFDTAMRWAHYFRKSFRQYHGAAMQRSRNNAVRTHRQRLKKQGLRRIEVQAVESDAQLIRRLARVLREDENRAVRLREQLKATLADEDSSRLKALLAEAPLEGVRITRSRD